MQSELVGIFQVKLVARYAMLGFLKPHFTHVMVNTGFHAVNACFPLDTSQRHWCFLDLLISAFAFFYQPVLSIRKWAKCR